MLRMGRTAAVVNLTFRSAVVGAAVLVFVHFCWYPFRCNGEEATLEAKTKQLFQAYRTAGVVQAARELVRQTLLAIRHCPSNVHLYMIAAANYQILDEYDAAAALYIRALAYDQRPELFLQLGLMQWNLHQFQAGYANLATAAEFNPELMAEVPPAAQYAVVRLLEKRLPPPQNELLNGDFSQRIANSTRSLTTTDHRPRASEPAPARGWNITNYTPAITVCQILRSSRDPDLNMLRISTSGGKNGLLQQWLPVNTGPAKVVSSAWVFVRRGRVFLGSGNGDASQRPDAISHTLYNWELITGINQSCPANETVIYAAGPEGADFDIEQVVVHRVLGQICYQ